MRMQCSVAGLLDKLGPISWTWWPTHPPSIFSVPLASRLYVKAGFAARVQTVWHKPVAQDEKIVIPDMLVSTATLANLEPEPSRPD